MITSHALLAELNGVSPGALSVAGFATIPHELHRARRAPLSRFFNRAHISKLENEILDLGSMTIDKMLRRAGGGPFVVNQALQCFTGDVISQYSFGQPMGFVAQEGWEPNFATWTFPFQRLSNAVCN